MFNQNNVLSFLEREIYDNLVEWLVHWLVMLDLKDTNSVRFFGHFLKE